MYEAYGILKEALGEEYRTDVQILKNEWNGYLADIRKESDKNMIEWEKSFEKGQKRFEEQWGNTPTLLAPEIDLEMYFGPPGKNSWFQPPPMPEWMKTPQTQAEWDFKMDFGMNLF